jgi:dodecin
MREGELLAMAKVVKVIELMSQSSKSWEDAAQGAVDEASKTLRNIRSLYIKSSRPKWTTEKSATIALTPKSHSIWSAAKHAEGGL